MSVCPKCGNEFEAQSGKYIRKFCSRVCANTRVFSNDALEKRSASCRTAYTKRTAEERQAHTRKAAETHKRNVQARLQNGPFEDLSMALKRKRVLSEQNDICAVCSIEQVWNGKALTFQLDHIDGNRKDNSRSNLRMICPNCHSQTETYCSKNKRNKVTEEVMREALDSNESVHQALGSIGLQPSGFNYKKARNLLN